MHGTAETPALFADVVCHAARAARPLLVGLEFDEDRQPAIDSFMSGRDATYQPGEVMHDGRHSAAMFALLERLRDLKNGGRQVEVVAFRRDSQAGHNQTPHELAMAAAWRERAAAHPQALTLILVGGLHARKARGDLAFVPAAAFLPPEATVSLHYVMTGGSAWVCMGTGADGPACGPRTARTPAGVVPPRGIVLKPEPGFDGRFSVGRPFTASPPAPGTQGR